MGHGWQIWFLMELAFDGVMLRQTLESNLVISTQDTVWPGGGTEGPSSHLCRAVLCLSHLTPVLLVGLPL